MPGSVSRMRPKGCVLKSSSISATSRLRRSSVRSSSTITSAITRPVTASTGTTTVCASRAPTAAARAFARRGDRFRMMRAMRPAAGLGQRFGHGMAGEEVADTRMVKPGAQNALQGRGHACQGIPQPVREPCGVGREVGVVTVEDAQLREQLVVAGVEPVHLTGAGCGRCRRARRRARTSLAPLAPSWRMDDSAGWRPARQMTACSASRARPIPGLGQTGAGSIWDVRQPLGRPRGHAPRTGSKLDALRLLDRDPHAVPR